MLNIIVDSREQMPFEFTHAKVNSVVTRKLNTGDYSLEEYENVLCIERKGSVAEFYKNITEKRFWAEMERMKAYPYRFIIFEFSVSELEMFPHGADLPKKVLSRLKISSAYLLKCVARIQVEYGIHVIFGEDRDNSVRLITNIMKELDDKSS